MTAAQPLKLSVVSTRKLSLTLPTPHMPRPRPGKEHSTLCWLHPAHTTIPTPSSDHGDLDMPSLSQKEVNYPRARAKSVCSSMKHRIWQNVLSTNTFFSENICQWTPVKWGYMLNQWYLIQLFNVVWNLSPFDFHPTAKQMTISSQEVVPKGNKEVW